MRLHGRFPFRPGFARSLSRPAQTTSATSSHAGLRVASSPPDKPNPTNPHRLPPGVRPVPWLEDVLLHPGTVRLRPPATTGTPAAEPLIPPALISSRRIEPSPAGRGSWSAVQTIPRAASQWRYGIGDRTWLAGISISAGLLSLASRLYRKASSAWSGE